MKLETIGAKDHIDHKLTIMPFPQRNTCALNSEDLSNTFGMPDRTEIENPGNSMVFGESSSV